MSNNSRIQSSLKNISNGLISQIISLVASFAVRTVFIKYLNEEYLGVNGLFTNILSILSLAELGFGSAIVYSMYKPLAENNNKKLQAIMNLYKKVYTYIGIIVGLIGMSIIPFMDYIIKNKPNVDNLILIYIMYLLNSVCSYFIAYKRSILTADQREYISLQYRYIFMLIKSIGQIVVLSIFKSFIFYLTIQIICTILENLFITNKINKIYPFLNEKNNEKLSKNEIQRIRKDVEALIISRFGSVMLNGTDNIIISSFVGIKWVGLLSNYNLVIGSVDMLVSQIIYGLTGSIGNFIAEKDQKERINLFKQVDLLGFWLYAMSSICLSILLNPFIELWIGNDYVIKQSTIDVLAINFFINGISALLWLFKSTSGLFTKGKYRPLISALLNIVISIILSKYIGLIGVLLGTTISRLLTNILIDPHVIYKYSFKESAKDYYISYMFRTILLICIYLCIDFVKFNIFINGVTISGFILLMILCMIFINFILFLVYKKSKEFKYIYNILKIIIIKIRMN